MAEAKLLTMFRPGECLFPGLIFVPIFIDIVSLGLVPGGRVGDVLQEVEPGEWVHVVGKSHESHIVRRVNKLKEHLERVL